MTSSRTPAALFLAVTVLWGIPYLLIAVALDAGWGPLSIAAGRVVLGAGVLLLVAGRRALSVFLSAPIRLTALAIVEVMVPFTLITWGEQTVASATAGVVIATEPTFVLLATLVFGLRRRPPAATSAGVVVGFGGLLLMRGAPDTGSGALIILGAAASYGLGATLVDLWFPDAPRLPLAAAMLTIAAPPMVIAAVLTEPIPALGDPAAAAMLGLGVASTAGGFAAFFALIGAAGAATAATITYTAPLIALSLGLVVLSEPLTWRMVGGTALVLAGAWLTLRSPTLSTPPGRPRRA